MAHVIKGVKQQIRFTKFFLGKKMSFSFIIISRHRKNNDLSELPQKATKFKTLKSNTSQNLLISKIF